ncbi:MAG: hybrid sensor histidine kinase/response regulator [Ktedonobacteraceae bacterium]|nr:hybrid sensor histidine kinase/response regulator [Ktedonobacteraceae bacterium]MBO0790600.1 hybrid sensor histidine kinase/response regulator [Ktedonobacteraceae bacterium]
MNVPYVLIVDDDPALLQALPQALSLRLQNGVTVDAVDSATEALKLIQVHDYDAIVSDIKMPGMDGLALLHKIQEIQPETPTLLITGHGEHDLAVQALRGGAYDFIQKPIERDYFIAALQRAIQTRQLRRQVSEQQRALEAHARGLEAEVLQRTRELVAANAAKDEFLSMASHELKTPLSSIKAMTQLLRRQFERASSPYVSNLMNMERSIKRMEILVNDLLNTSIIETGMFALNKERYDLVALCRHLYDEYLMSTHHSISLDVPDESLEVEIDVNRISQVILNLLSNAQKYSPSGTPINVSLKRVEGEGVISVRDQGVGIPQSKLPYIFDRFFRVPEVEVQTGSSIGLGLGLYIARMIVERHDGRIEVDSVQGNGSTFTVTLPLLAETRLTATEVHGHENNNPPLMPPGS